MGGRAVGRAEFRPAVFAEIADTPAWWGALGALGATLLAAGALAAVGAGEAIAIGGVVLFLATAVLGGAERWEGATASAVAGMIWTSVGIALASGSDGASAVTALVLVASGLALGAVALGGLARARRG